MGVPFDATMNVYSSADDFTATVATGVACRLTQPRSAPSIALRAEEAPLRTLLYDPAYASLPGSDGSNASAQVLISGQRWNCQRGTEAAPTAFGAVHHRRVIVMRAS